MGSEEEDLSFDPSDRRGELVSKPEFYEDDVGELLTLFSRAPVPLIPPAKDLVETGRGRLVERIRIEVNGIDLFSKVYGGFVSIHQPRVNKRLTNSERHHTGPQVAGVEGDINTGQRDCDKTLTVSKVM